MLSIISMYLISCLYFRCAAGGGGVPAASSVTARRGPLRSPSERQPRSVYHTATSPQRVRVKQDDALCNSSPEVAAETRPSLRLQPVVCLVSPYGPHPTHNIAFFYLYLEPFFSLDLQLQQNFSVCPASLTRPVRMENNIQLSQFFSRTTRAGFYT